MAFVPRFPKLRGSKKRAQNLWNNPSIANLPSPEASERAARLGKGKNGKFQTSRSTRMAPDIMATTNDARIRDFDRVACGNGCDFEYSKALRVARADSGFGSDL